MWAAAVFTLFPDMFPGPLGLSLAGDALARGVWSCTAHDIRAHGLGRHRTVDDRPAGGGPGMVMRADVVAAALDTSVPREDARPRFLMSPRGTPLTQAEVRGLASGPGVVLVCGRFEGIDERVIAARGLTEVSIGDYVLSGGELAAMVLLDACVRLLPGVMGAEASGRDESFEAGLLEYSHYTRPRSFEGHDIPEVLLGGDHGRIAAWRQAEARRLTSERRPELLRAASHGPDPAKSEADRDPAFARDFIVEAIGPDTITVRRRSEQAWWRFEVAEKNGRRQLLHVDQSPGPPSGPGAANAAVDAYDTATLEARRLGLVD